MAHKADKKFFDAKRPWSQRKDQILAHYLTPYLAKVAHLGKPILLVDGFAGPGKFGDGEDGSPLIMCKAAAAAAERGTHVKVLCVEKDPELFGQLKTNTSTYSFAHTLHGAFLEAAEFLRQLAESHTVFLYIDPFTVDGLDWDAMVDVLRQIHKSRSSVEVLLNFHAPIFERRARQLLHYADAVGAEDHDDLVDALDRGFANVPTEEKLNVVVGGPWWKDIERTPGNFSETVVELVQELASRLRKACGEAVFVPINEKDSHSVPKYYLLFGTRHVDGLKLMNDEMVNARGRSIFYSDLFSKAELDAMLLKHATARLQRGELIAAVIRSAYAMYRTTEIRGRIEHLLKTCKLISGTGKVRINDTVCVWPSTQPLGD